MHVDRLPQLVNIILGDMSLVGPRPERPEFVAPLSDSIPGYAVRLTVKPGISGLGPNPAPRRFRSRIRRRKIVLDRLYIDGQSPWLDLRLIAGTAMYLTGPRQPQR